eukprot:gb/GEZN01006232.1/.p1 GENE.gb/GEZN01006232.1/~~gb/GEZN01006232.1/.p1  ORF type:complete len:538 (+),score=74.54 gb/GEZN01006232.1/:172-1614(+)
MEMGKLKEVVVETEGDVEPRITMGAGVRWQDAYEMLDGTGYAVMGGTCPSVGVVGFTLGGGFNHYLSRHWGTGADNALSFTVVLFDGQVVNASATSHPELWWSLRGGGGGNMGMVTSLTARLHWTGDLFPLQVAEYFGLDKLQFDVVTQAWARWTQMLRLQEEPRIGTMLEWNGKDLNVTVLWSGGVTKQTVGEFKELLAELQVPIPDRLQEKTLTWLEFEQRNPLYGVAAPFPLRWYGASAFVSELSPAILDTMWTQSEARNSMLFEVSFEAGHESSFIPRDAVYLLNPLYFWQDEADDARLLAQGFQWMQKIRQQGVFKGAYLNYIDRQLQDWARVYYGENLSRLQRVKVRYDPFNKFNFPMSIPLPPASPVARPYHSATQECPLVELPSTSRHGQNTAKRESRLPSPHNPLQHPQPNTRAADEPSTGKFARTPKWCSRSWPPPALPGAGSWSCPKKESTLPSWPPYSTRASRRGTAC